MRDGAFASLESPRRIGVVQIYRETVVETEDYSAQRVRASAPLHDCHLAAHALGWGGILLHLAPAGYEIHIVAGKIAGSGMGKTFPDDAHRHVPLRV